MVDVARGRASLCAVWCDRACPDRSRAAWNRLRRSPGKKARGEFKDITRGSRQGFDDLRLDRQKQRRRSHPDRARHGINSCRVGATKAGARRSDRHAGGASNRRRCCEPGSGLSSTGRLAPAGRSATCGIAGRASSSLTFASGSVITTGPGFTRPNKKSMTVLNVSTLSWPPEPWRRRLH